MIKVHNTNRQLFFYLLKSIMSMITEELDKWNLSVHCGILEHWNSQKSLTSIPQHFSCQLDDGIAKICKEKFSRWLFEIIHITHYEMHNVHCTWTVQINLKKIELYQLFYQSLLSIICHDWFPSSKRTLKLN